MNNCRACISLALNPTFPRVMPQKFKFDSSSDVVQAANKDKMKVGCL
jgi:hypothetical protein